ncbi:hypothetical protein JFU48_29500 [Pseudomonas sp. TH49]|uniref:Uncharacterized protein n=1 Tax=Pseudomonas fluorescens TaxID=294 RepID=A0AAP8YZA4_PSEFL|nr:MULTISPECIES: hypothetical protein [Pseudomonas]MBK5345475.1 hypothetical protein [Pseudomonas sp. TH49]QBX40418.1 hypothetical protein E4T63_07360 [Pseudomonas fluorescens]
MDNLLFKFRDVEIWKRNERYFIRYDAGGHVDVMREDEITEGDALKASVNEEAAIQFLFVLQERLISEGVDPYVSNV